MVIKNFYPESLQSNQRIHVCLLNLIPRIEKPVG